VIDENVTGRCEVGWCRGPPRAFFRYPGEAAITRGQLLMSLATAAESGSDPNRSPRRFPRFRELTEPGLLASFGSPLCRCCSAYGAG
jgi:hypothetical protein